MTSKLPRAAIEPLSRAAWDRVESRLFASLDRGEHSKPEPANDTSARRAWKYVAWAVPVLAAAAAAAFTFVRGHSPSNAPIAVPPIAAGTPAAGTPAAGTPAGATLVAGTLALESAPGVSAAAVSAPGTAAASGSPSPVALPDKSRIETTADALQSKIGDSEVDVAPHSSVRVSGSDLRGWLIELEAGRVAFHVAPRHARPPFVVQTGEVRVTVVGTRFSVERRESAASVVVQEGIVRVQSGEQDVLLGPGQRWPEEAAEAFGGSPVSRPAAATTAGDGSNQTGSVERKRFERAARLEATRPRAALRIYAELSRKGAWAANALYARGRLELQLGQPRGKKDLRLYLKRFPTGPNAEDVRRLLGDTPDGSSASSSR